MQKLFVTGGAGFIGSAFIRLLIERYPTAFITNFDNLTYAGNPDNIAGINSDRYRFVKGDIADPPAVLAALDEQTDAIVNFAAESHVDRSLEHARGHHIAVKFFSFAAAFAFSNAVRRAVSLGGMSWGDGPCARPALAPSSRRSCTTAGAISRRLVSRARFRSRISRVSFVSQSV